MKKLLCILLLFMALSFADSTTSTTPTPFTSTFYSNMDWVALSAIAAALSVVIAAALIIFSRMFSLKNLEQVAKTEFVFAVSTVVIVIIVAALINAAEPEIVKGAKCIYLGTFGCSCENADSMVFFQQTKTLADFVDLYMQSPKKCAEQSMDLLYMLAIPVDAAASVYTEIFMSEISSGFGLKPLSERIKNTSQMLTFYLYVYYILMYTFQFIKFFAGFFFSIGVIMRAFPTRGAGAYMMAAAVGFYFVFPLSYLIFTTISLPSSWQTTSLTWTNAHTTGDPLPCQETQINSHFEELCGAPELSKSLEKDLNYEGCGTGGIRWIKTMVGVVKANQNLLQTWFTSQTGITGLLDNMINIVCIAPIVAMVITMTFILNTTNLFGGNIPEIGRGLVKLI